MRLFHRLCILFLASIIIAGSARGQQVAINELYNSGGMDEWLELLVVQDSIDMRGWDIRDFSSGGAAQLPLEFTSHATWQNLRAGTIIVVARPENTALQEDIDPSDYSLVIKSNNAAFFTGNVFLFAAASEAVQVRTSTDTHVFGVSWGTSNAGSLPAPKVHFTGSASGNTSTSFNEDSVPELTVTTNWTMNNTSPTLGAGNTPTNTAWINSFRSRADGSGTATIAPDTLNGGVVGPIVITYRPDTTYVITDLRIIIPSSFGWSRLVSDVSFTNMTATNTVSGDTVYFNNVAFSAESTVITMANVTSPESTAIYQFVVQSRVNVFGNVSPIPRIVVFGLPIPIAEAKANDSLGVPLLLNSLITVRGVVTVANEFGGPSYIQDNSGGFAIFGSSFSTAVAPGDEVVVSGLVQPFSGLSEIVNPILHSVLSTGNTVEPLVATANQIFSDGVGGLEVYEGRLVRINNATVTGGGTWTANTNYPLNDPSGSTQVRIDNNTNLVGAPIPPGAFDVVGVVGQFITAPPYIGGYQLMPRSLGDIISSGPIFATYPVETAITPTSLTIFWQTINNGTTYARYGRTPALELGVVGNDTMQTSHTITLTSLDPATVYYIRAFSVGGTDTSAASTLIASTASPAQSTGVINVFFNKSVNTSIAWFQPAAGNQDFIVRFIPRINTAQRSVDAALYSLSGTPGSTIAAALVNAKNRGVKVRVICEDDNRNSAPYNTIAGAGIPIITDRFDAINNGVGLHHNKFFVIDARGGAPESVWVWTGSWNPSDPGTNSDYQNVVEIQDAALANAYTLEFNEMWGSSTEVPNAGASRFGVRKTDNTPHRFVIGGRSVESYFSPSDRTTSKIISVITGAAHSIGFALLTVTRADIATAIVARKNLGVAVRGLMDNNTDQGSQYNYLLSQGVDLHLKTGSGLLHHKYGIVDAEYPYWNSVTITGSHNWSSAAENANNENTLIIRDGNITNQFLQEFAARYYQFGGTDTILVNVDNGGGQPGEFSLSQNYPNPFNPGTRINYQIPHTSFITLTLYDVLGREVETLVNGVQEAGTHGVSLDAGRLASGVYFYRLQATPARGGQPLVSVRKMVLLK